VWLQSEVHGDAGLREVQEGDIIQIERRGFYRCDRPYINDTKPLILFMIPDGKQKAMSTLSTKLTHR
jgi:glutamyl-tRNA synthetase